MAWPPRLATPVERESQLMGISSSRGGARPLCLELASKRALGIRYRTVIMQNRVQSEGKVSSIISPPREPLILASEIKLLPPEAPRCEDIHAAPNYFSNAVYLHSAITGQQKASETQDFLSCHRALHRPDQLVRKQLQNPPCVSPAVAPQRHIVSDDPDPSHAYSHASAPREASEASIRQCVGYSLHDDMGYLT